MKYIIIFSLFFFLFIGCSSNDKANVPEHLKDIENLIIHPADVKPIETIELVRETSFGETDKVHITGFLGIEIDSAGKVYIGNSGSELAIHVFNSDASYLADLGKRGSGPGEFRSIADMRIINNKLYIHDPNQLKVNVYSLGSLEFSHELKVKRNAANQEDYEELLDWFTYQRIIYSDSTFLASFIKHPRDVRNEAPSYNLGKERTRKHYLMNYEGKIISDKLFEQRDARDLLATVDGRRLYNHFPVSFLGNSMISVTDDGHIFTAWSEEFLIKVYGPGGNYQRAFYYPFRRKNLSRDEIIALYKDKSEWNRTLAKHAELPEKWPVFNAMLSDDKNRLWVATIINGKIHEWWVLEKSGKLIAKFEWPRDKQIEEVKNGYMYTRETDEMGVEAIVKYKITME